MNYLLIILHYKYVQLLKNCKDQTLFESGGTVDIHAGLNVKADLPVILTDQNKLGELQNTVNEIAPIQIGQWRLSVTGVVNDVRSGLIPPSDADLAHQI